MKNMLTVIDNLLLLLMPLKVRQFYVLVKHVITVLYQDQTTPFSEWKNKYLQLLELS